MWVHYSVYLPHQLIIYFRKLKRKPKSTAFSPFRIYINISFKLKSNQFANMKAKPNPFCVYLFGSIEKSKHLKQFILIFSPYSAASICYCNFNYSVWCCFFYQFTVYSYFPTSRCKLQRIA